LVFRDGSKIIQFADYRDYNFDAASRNVLVLTPFATRKETLKTDERETNTGAVVMRTASAKETGGAHIDTETTIRTQYFQTSRMD